MLRAGVLLEGQFSLISHLFHRVSFGFQDCPDQITFFYTLSVNNLTKKNKAKEQWFSFTD